MCMGLLEKHCNESRAFQKLSFPIDLYENECDHLVFTIVFNYYLSVVFSVYFGRFSSTLELDRALNKEIFQ